MPCLVRVRILIKLEVVLTVNTKNVPVSRTKPKEKDHIKQFINMRISYPAKVPCFSFTYPIHTHHVLHHIVVVGTTLTRGYLSVLKVQELNFI